MRVANAANLGIIAERSSGSAQGFDDVVYLNGGASGIVAGGRLLAGRSGYAGEIGHTLVDPGGPLCHCGSRGCLEALVWQSHLLEAAEAGTDFDTSELLLRALMLSPSALRRDEMTRQADYSTLALRNVVLTFNAARIVLGGFVGMLFETTASRIENSLRRQTIGMTADDVTVTTAKLGSAILLRGAAALVFGSILDRPAALASVTSPRHRPS